MRKRLLLLAGVVLVVGGGIAAVVVASGPSATRGLNYRDIDAKYLDRTLVVVAAARNSTTSFRMKGATLFVDSASGDVQRIDNDGVSNVALAFDGRRVGFVDESHDYLLGEKNAVHSREWIDGSPYGSFWVDDVLVTALNGGFGEEHYHLEVSESSVLSTTQRTEAGYVESIAQCDDELWMIRNPDFESLDHSPGSVIDRLAPSGGASWKVETDRGDLGFEEAACRGSRLVALGSTEVGDRSTDVIADIDLDTGKSTLVPVTGIQSTGRSVDYTFWAATLGERGFYVAAEPPHSETTAPAELLRIDPTTGKVTHVGLIERRSDVRSHFRFQDDHLYVLDVTSETDSRLRAYRLSDGKLVGTRAMEPLDSKLNGPFDGFDARLLVWDFAVTTSVDRW